MSQCDQNSQRMDAHLDHGLAANEETELREHLERCATCSAEVEARRNLRNRLRSAVHDMEAPRHLETRIRSSINGTRRREFPGGYLAVAAAILVCLGAGTSYQFGHLRFTKSSQESYIGSVSSRVATLMRVGLGDHIHCAVFRKYPKDPPKIEELTGKLPAEYRGLIDVLRDRVPGDYRLIMAHQCRYHERSFVHLTLKNESGLLSLVITRKSRGESFGADSSLAIHHDGVQRFQIAAFESRDYLVYVVSDLDEEGNSQMMLGLAPAIREQLHKLEL
jgi:hypothetical protein